MKNEVKVYVGGSWAALLLLLWDRRQRGLCGRFRVSFPIFCEEKSVVPKFHMTLTPLQQVLPRQPLVKVIQAKAEGKIIASERIQAKRK